LLILEITLLLKTTSLVLFFILIFSLAGVSQSHDKSIDKRGRNQTNSLSQEPEEFLRQRKVRKAGHTNNDVRVELKATVIQLKQVSFQNRMISVLSIPVKITNYSRRAITTILSHEWYGGIPPLTDFFVAAQKTSGSMKMFWDTAPAYQVGNLGSITGKTVLKPQETITLNIRLNWYGTGSVPTEPLIEDSLPNKHVIKFALFFEADGSKQYLITQNFQIEVKK
jgi:hypothetical protein